MTKQFQSTRNCERRPHDCAHTHTIATKPLFPMTTILPSHVCAQKSMFSDPFVPKHNFCQCTIASILMVVPTRLCPYIILLPIHDWELKQNITYLLPPKGWS